MLDWIFGFEEGDLDDGDVEGVGVGFEGWGYYLAIVLFIEAGGMDLPHLKLAHTP